MTEVSNEHNWQDADMVELHDANVVIHRKGYPDGAVGWTECGCQRKTYYVHGLRNLLEAAGVPGPHMYTENNVRRELNNYEGLTIVSEPSLVGYSSKRGHEITKLEAATDGDLLHLRTRCRYEHGDEEHLYQQSVTYRGSFSVWWRVLE